MKFPLEREDLWKKKMEERRKNLSKSKIERRMQSKRDASLIKAIIRLKKTNPEFAKELAKPKRKWVSINLKDLDMIEGDVVVAGKVLSAGELTRPKRIVAWAASEKALEKMKDAQADFTSLLLEIEKNPELNNLVIVR